MLIHCTFGFVRQLPMLAAVLGGRTQLSLGEMKNRNLLLLFTHVLGLLELLQPQIFHQQHTALASILEAYFMLFKVKCHFCCQIWDFELRPKNV